MNLLMQQAISLAEQGRRVFPVMSVDASLVCECEKAEACDRPGKHARIRNWQTEATTNRAKIENWWTRWPTASIAIATGRESNLLVVDVDGDPGRVTLTRLSAQHGGDPVTLKVRTGRGYHLYFQYSDALPTGTNVLGEGVDVRSDDGYVIAPPSLHVSGARYEFENASAEVVPLPDWMRPAPARRRRAARTESVSDLSLEEIPSLLAAIDPDDRDKWLKVGVILGRMFDASMEAWTLYESWASRSEKFQEHHAENIERMRDMFFTRSQEPPRAGRDEVGPGTLIHWAREGGWERPTPLRDSDHWRLAQAIIESIEQETGERPVYALGALWLVEEGIWQARTLDSVAMLVAKRFAGGKYCKRGSDFASIANVVAKSCDNEGFFEGAAVGIAAPGGFWRVTEEGEIRCERLTAAHRQRMRVRADPDLDAEPTLLLKVLRDAFDGDEADEQIRLVQQLFGCAITRSLWRHRVVALFLGATNSGKSTLLTLLSSVFPDDQLGACSPQRWGDEYYVAALAGVALNVVGDLDKKEPIPGYFKNVVGRDAIQGRHPTHRPFTFVCEASHFFNSNHCPPTADHSDAFFNRWRIVYFRRSVPAGQRDRNLDQRLKSEETGAMLGWALRGAAEVNRAGTVMETKPHAVALRRWRVANNSALAFLCDDNECELRPAVSTPGQAVFDAYKKWAADNGMRAFGRNGFYDALTEGAGQVGIEVVTRDNQTHVSGVRLKRRDDDPRF